MCIRDRFQRDPSTRSLQTQSSTTILMKISDFSQSWGSNEWVPAVVIETLEEMIRIEYGEGRGTSRWVFYDSEQLAPPNKGATRARDWFEGSRLLKQSTQTIHVLQGVCVCLSV
eukprot:TRINITY_DN1689_c0_g1_i5.p2 TRINITY_DN1689_c0_g1~~TRINITY_DN1689_c0_g1_i5.p2  ORF type:complete len:114 (+),score=3.02 TRINITY_DN1689_c0_g1_i5:66-407(+)